MAWQWIPGFVEFEEMLCDFDFASKQSIKILIQDYSFSSLWLKSSPLSVFFGLSQMSKMNMHFPKRKFFRAKEAPSFSFFSLLSHTLHAPTLHSQSRLCALADK